MVGSFWGGVSTNVWAFQKQADIFHYIMRFIHMDKLDCSSFQKWRFPPLPLPPYKKGLHEK